jgi:CRP/FNR family transcriptional regulator, dissimilatory nitrate respiration regulator
MVFFCPHTEETMQTKQEKLDIPALLSRLPLFQELTPEQIAPITAGTREKRLAKGEMLFQKGDPPKGFFIIVFGQVKLAFHSASGNEKVVEILGPRQSFGEAVMFMDRPYPIFAEALLDTLLLHVSMQAVFDLLGSDPMFARRMLAGMATRLHSLINDVESYSLRSSAQRVIGYLLQHCPQGENCEGQLEISLPTSKQIIASRLNLTPETLSRIFHELSEAGLITVQGKVIKAHDMRRLREYDL